MSGPERFVLAVASIIVVAGMVGVVWRELFAPVEAPDQGRLRLAVEVALPAIGVGILLVWLWT